MESPKPHLIVYSLVLPAVWFALAQILTQIAPGKNVGIGGVAIKIYIAIIIVSWIMARAHRRPFSNAEAWREIGYCTVWSIILESFGLVYAMAYPEEVGFELSKGQLAVALGIAAVMNFLFIFAGFKYLSPKFVSWYLRGGDASTDA